MMAAAQHLTVTCAEQSDSLPWWACVLIVAGSILFLVAFVCGWEAILD